MLRSLVLAVPILGLGLIASASAASPRVGDTAADFTLNTPTGEPVRLTKLLENGPVVLVVLRGWPGYQCPLCTRQVGELIGKSENIASTKAQVLMVYPGPAADLQAHAQEFAKGKTLPAGYHFVIDPDYVFTNQYNLRWNDGGETAYPSTFVINPQAKIVYAKTSTTHGGRAPIGEVLGALKGK